MRSDGLCSDNNQTWFSRGSSVGLVGALFTRMVATLLERMSQTSNYNFPLCHCRTLFSVAKSFFSLKLTMFSYACGSHFFEVFFSSLCCSVPVIIFFFFSGTTVSLTTNDFDVVPIKLIGLAQKKPFFEAVYVITQGDGSHAPREQRAIQCLLMIFHLPL